MATQKIIFFTPQQEARPEPKPERVGGMITLCCLTCQKAFEKRLTDYNYWLKKGVDRFFCSKSCFHVSRRDNKSEAQKKAEKAEYDRQYREKNVEALKVKKHLHFKRTYDPVQAAIERKKRMPKHVEYCRRPAYRAYKADYDKKYHAKKQYGEFWECHLLANQIQKEYDDRVVRQENSLHNKSQTRKRLWHRLKNSLQVL